MIFSKPCLPETPKLISVPREAGGKIKKKILNMQHSIPEESLKSESLDLVFYSPFLEKVYNLFCDRKFLSGMNGYDLSRFGIIYIQE